MTTTGQPIPIWNHRDQKKTTNKLNRRKQPKPGLTVVGMYVLWYNFILGLWFHGLYSLVVQFVALRFLRLFSVNTWPCQQKSITAFALILVCYFCHLPWTSNILQICFVISKPIQLKYTCIHVNFSSWQMFSQFTDLWFRKSGNLEPTIWLVFKKWRSESRSSGFENESSWNTIIWVRSVRSMSDLLLLPVLLPRTILSLEWSVFKRGFLPCIPMVLCAFV